MNKMVKFFHTAGITIQVNSDYPIGENTFHPKFKLFETMGPGGDNVVVNHHFHLPDLLYDPELIKHEIYKKDQWHIFKTPDSWIYRYHPVFPEDPQHTATGIFNLDHTVVDIYTDDFTQAQYQDARFTALTLFNTDQILFSHLLCLRQGLIIHANGFKMSGRGILLVGQSGAGKSTLSQMLKNQKHEILCDDRMFITKKDSFWIYGNWCHGSVPDISQNGLLLSAVFFLKKSHQNNIILIKNNGLIVPAFIKTIVKPFLNENGWEKTLKTIEKIISTTPFYQLEFDLSGKICDELYDLTQKMHIMKKETHA